MDSIWKSSAWTRVRSGLKDAILFMKETHAYGYLYAEKGIHRLVRLSPFNANDKRQTSFYSISVSPEIDDIIVRRRTVRE